MGADYGPIPYATPAGTFNNRRWSIRIGTRMKSHVRVAVIGGGVVGCSVLYHLTKRGWREVMLLERAELTAGSTWHAAGGMHSLNGDANVAALQDYTIRLYREIEQLSQVSCGIHTTGCLYLAVTDREVEFFHAERTKAKLLKLDLDFISLKEARRLNPLIESQDYRAAMFDPNDGHVDPSGVTHAYAKAARDAGAEIVRHAPVTSIQALPGGEWLLTTSKGEVRAQYVVNAAGLWAREVGRLLGVELPIVPMEHQYIVTQDIAELAALGREIPAAVDFDGAAYLRQERLGVLLGTYERDCRHWAVNGTPADFGVELLPEDLERISGPLQVVTNRMPALARAGIKRVVNGGMVFSPDGNPIIGPLPGKPTAFMAAGCMAGFSQGGGVGLAVANWIVDGEPGMDVHAMDLARFGQFATAPYVLAKTRENYQRRFILPCPNEELQAARPLRTSSLYERLQRAGAVFGAGAGWEVPLWFAADPKCAAEEPTFRRTAAFEAVAAECRAVREQVGIWDISSYCKLELSGPAAERWLEGVVANRVPRDVGRLVLAPMLTVAGRILGDVTLLKAAPDRFLMFGSPGAEAVYLRWLHGQIGAAEVSIRSLSSALGGVAITGPRSRELLAQVSSADVSNVAHPFLQAREMTVGLAPCTVLRVSFTGELGYEIYAAPEYLPHVYDRLIQAGHLQGIRNFGVRALNALRLEKGYGGWGREYTQDYDPAEAGWSRWVRIDKGPYIGSQAAAIALSATPGRRLQLLRIDSRDPDPVGGEPVLLDGRPIARLTSAAFAHTVGYAMGLAYLPSSLDRDALLEVQVLSHHYPARVLAQPPHDPSGSRMRG